MAVAVAGLAAYESRRRRAVVLVPSTIRSDESLDPVRGRAYLEDLRVPFFVWDPESGSSERHRAWGSVKKVGSIKDLAAAFEELTEFLDRQWVVWIDGKHLPQEIRLSGEAKDFVLVEGAS